MPVKKLFWLVVNCCIYVNAAFGNTPREKYHLYAQAYLLTVEGALDSLKQQSKNFALKQQWHETMKVNNLIMGLNTAAGKVKENKKLLKQNLSIKRNSKDNFSEELCYTYFFAGEYKFHFNEIDSCLWYFRKSEMLASDNFLLEVLANIEVYRASIAFNNEDFPLILQNLGKASGYVQKGNLQTDKIHYKLLNAYGHYYEMMGDFEKSQGYYRKTVEVFNGMTHYSKSDSSHLAIFYNNLGASYYRKGDFHQALTYYQKAKFLLQKLYELQGATYARLTNNIGLSYFKSNDLNLARKNFLESLKYSDKPETKKGKENFISTSNHLARYYLQVGEVDSAFIFLNKILTLKPKVNYRLNITYWGVSDVFFAKHQIEKAKDYAKKALNICLNEYGPGHPEISKAYSKLAELAVFENKFTEALDFYNKAFKNFTFFDNGEITGLKDISERVGLNREILQLFHHKSKVLYAIWKEDQRDVLLEKAFKNIEWASAIADSLRNDYLEEGSKLNLAELAKLVYEDAIEICSEMGKKNNAFFEKAFQFSEKSKGIVLLQALKKQEAINRNTFTDSLFLRQKTLRLNIGFYKSKFLEAKQKNDSVKTALYEAYLIDNKYKEQELSHKIKQKYPGYYKQKYHWKPVWIASIKDKLVNDKTALISYFFGEKKSWIFCITHTDFKVYNFNSNDELNKEILDLRTIITNNLATEKDLGNFMKSGNSIYERILAEPLKNLNREVTDLIIIPDKNLWLLPFEVLLETPAKNKTSNFKTLPYLIKNWTISYGYSCNLLLLSAEKEKLQQNNCIAFAPFYNEKDTDNPLQGDLTSLRNEPVGLPSTFNEIKAIAHNFKGTFYMGNRATKERFLKESPEFGVIHLALHGIANDKSPEQTRLLFRSETNDSTASLFIHEMMNLDLKAHLVVLSACETGVGKINDGEGVISMGRGFLQAGVPAIITSLWKIPDRATSEIMKLFYNQLAEGNFPQQALKNAKLDYLNRSDELTAHPFFWAAFINLGISDKINNQNGFWNSNTMYAVLFFLFVLLVLIWIVKKKKALSGTDKATN